MSKVYFTAFVFIAGAAAAGTDYLNQSRIAGYGPGELSAADYVDTIPRRFRGEEPATAPAPLAAGGEPAVTDTNPVPTAQTTPVADPENPGMLARLAGFFSGGNEAEEVVAEAEAEPEPEVKVTRKAGSDNCAKQGGTKRCRIGDN